MQKSCLQKLAYSLISTQVRQAVKLRLFSSFGFGRQGFLITLLTYLLILIGFVLLLGGGEFLVRGAVDLAHRLGVSPLVIGLTVVGFGTSAPELVASIKAVFNGAPGLAVGTVIGSNISNGLLVLGAAALITPILCKREAFIRDGSMLLGATLLTIVICITSARITRWEGGLLFLLVIAFVVFSYYSDMKTKDAGAELHEAEAGVIDRIDGPIWKPLIVVIGGLIGVLFGASLLVDNAIVLARDLGVSDTVIGLSVVAIGTSLPELATALIAAFKRQADVALGNVIGSNIFNLLGILGTTALFKPIQMPDDILSFDLWALLATTVLLIVTAISGWRFSRWEGALFLAVYAGYLTIVALPSLRATIGLL
jgi:cation:H+ antiporter|tara:strand:+ start:245 stop:1348 length:1104 start_codon:yes stop_codon:yes gene_type:complete